MSESSAINRRELLETAGLAAALVLAAYGLQVRARNQLPGYLRGQLARAIGRPVRFGAIHAWPPGRLSIEASWVHMSHAQLFGRENPGIDNLGVRLNLAL